MRRFALLLLPFCLLAAPGQAQESGRLDKIKQSGVVKIGHRESSIPFSYYDDRQKPVGYAMDLCAKVVDALSREAGRALRIETVPVTPATRIPLVANGTIDLECGSTSNTIARQSQVAFSITDFVTATRFVSKKVANLKTLDDLKGKTVATTAGTTTITTVNELNSQKGLDLRIIAAKDHAEAFLMVETDRAVAFFMDDVLLASLAASSKAPGDYVISQETYSLEPYGIILPKGDAAFKAVVDRALVAIYGSGEIAGIYDKWFMRPIPPRGINMNLPMSEAFRKVVAKPTDSGDPASY